MYGKSNKVCPHGPPFDNPILRKICFKNCRYLNILLYYNRDDHFGN